jgi:Zn-dependent protease with chaperone function
MLQACYCDGRSTRIRTVTLSMVGGELAIVGEDTDLRVPFVDVVVDERLGRAPRRLRLKDGAFCELHDLDGLDALLSSTVHRDGWVDRMQRHLPIVLLSVIACVALAAVTYKWALPWAAAKAADHLPPAVGRSLSKRTLKLLDGRVLSPSRIAPEHRQRLSAEFQALRLPEGGNLTSPLLFRASDQLRANAFTLPDGTIVVLDDLITSINDDQQTLAVLAHELGHVHRHDGLRLILQGAAIAAFVTFYVGDSSNVLAIASTVVVQARYSQSLERQADDYGIAVLLHNGMSPSLLADALEKLAANRPNLTGGYLSSHPPTAERIRHLRMLAAASTDN